LSEIINLDERNQPLSFGQRWNSYLSLAVVALALIFGLTMRSNTLNAAQTFEDLEAGIRANIPNGWLLDARSTDYVLRAEDPNALPFKTMLQVSVIPVGPDATPTNVLMMLNAERPSQFPGYKSISIKEETWRDGSPAIRLTYAYTQDERNPFLESMPLVIEGVDVIVLRRSQAVIITYREERSAFEENLYRFDNLLRTVEIF